MRTLTLADQRHRFLVYLAGPITGLSYEGATDWRQYVIDRLPEEIGGLSPMRCKPYLAKEKILRPDYNEWPLSTAKGIYCRDRFDCKRADIVLVNVLGATIVSIGTVMEIAWAADNNTPVVIIREKGDNLHTHRMLDEACPFIVETLDEGIEIVKAVLLPGNHQP